MSAPIRILIVIFHVMPFLIVNDFGSSINNITIVYARFFFFFSLVYFFATKEKKGKN